MIKAVIERMTLGLAAALFVLAPLAGSAQDQKPAVAPAVEMVPATEHWDTKSKLTGRTYRIFVSKPSTAAPKGGWPIFYVLDGNLFFPTASQVAWMNVSGGSKPALVVGIGYPTNEVPAVEALRFGDLAPRFTELDAKQRQQIADASPRGTVPGKGAEPFFRFMQEELRPQLVKKYPVNAGDMTLWGHSLGGLFVVETLFKHPTAFRNYIASSASIHFQDRQVLQGEAAFAKSIDAGQAKPNVLILVGQNEQRTYPKDLPLPAGMEGISREDLDKESASTRMVDNARELAERLAKLKNVKVQYHRFDDEGHLSVVPASLSRSVTFSLGGAAF